MNIPLIDDARIRAIAAEVAQNRLDQERELVGKTFRTALSIAGISLTALVSMATFFGWQRIDDIRKDALGEAREEIRRYIDAGAAADLRAEIDTQYGIALVRTLRAEALQSEGRLEIEDTHASRLVDVLLSKSTEEPIFSETIDLLRGATIGDDGEHHPTWWPKAQARLVEASLNESTKPSIGNARRVAILGLLAADADAGVVSSLRQILQEKQADSDTLAAVLSLERRVQPSEPLNLALLRDLAKTHAGSPDLQAQIDSILVLRYPDSAEALHLIADRSTLRDTNMSLYIAVSTNLIHDAYADTRNNSEPVNIEVHNRGRDAAYTVGIDFLQSCDKWDISTNGNESDDDSSASGGGISTARKATITYSISNKTTYIRGDSEDFSTVELSSLARFTLRNAAKRSTLEHPDASELVKTIDWWHSHVSAGAQIRLRAGRVIGSVPQIYLHKVLVRDFTFSRPAYELVTVPLSGERLPALEPIPQSDVLNKAQVEPRLPIPFDLISGAIFSMQVLKSPASMTPSP